MSGGVEIGTETLEIKLFGTPRIKYNGRDVSADLSIKSQALVYYLSAKKTTQSRLTLAGLLWPNKDEQSSRVNLRQTIRQLRKTLPNCLWVTRDTVALKNMADTSVDLHLFQKHAQLVDKDLTHDLGQAVAHYGGDFLDGFFVNDAEMFEMWLHEERAFWHAKAVQYLNALITNAHRQRNVSLGLKYAYRLNTLEPWDENNHRHMLRFLVWNGQINKALAQYELCRQTLLNDLQLTPSPETTALYDRIQRLRLQERPFIPNNLAPLLGREEVVHDMKRLLYQGERLITLLGPGGIGKTAISLELARNVTPTYFDGVYWVDLSDVAQIHELVWKIAAALQLDISNQKDPGQQLRHFLQDRELLLILDNFEQLQTRENLDLLNQLIETSPSLQIVVTSRTRLYLRREIVYRLDSLTFPESERGLTLRQARSYSAIQLFDRQAQRTNREFSLADEFVAVSRICRLVEGLPLAIELAAALTENKCCQEIAQQIESNLKLLTSPFYDAPDRQKSLEATFIYSWSLLSANEQDLLTQLAVFRGGFTETAVQTITDASRRPLSALIAKSMVAINEKRYGLHAVTHHFVSQRLREREDNSVFYNRHSRYYLRTALEQPNLLGSSAAQARQWFSTESNNIEQAWQWAVRQANWEYLDAVAQTLSLGLFFTGHIQKILQLFEFAGEHLNRTDETLTTPIARQLAARLAAYQSQPLHQLGRLTEADKKLEEAFDLIEDECSEVACIATIYKVKNDTLRQTYHPDHQQKLEWALQLARQNGWSYWETVALNSLAVHYLNQFNFPQARVHLKQLVQRCQELGYIISEISAYSNLGVAAWQEGDYQTALQNYQFALAGHQQVNEPVGQILVNVNLAILTFHLGQLAQSWQYSAAALDICHQQGEQWLLCTVYNYQGRTLLQQTNYPEAAAILNRALKLGHQVENQPAVCESLFNLTLCDFQQDRLEQAMAWGRQASEKIDRLGLKQFQGGIAFMLGLIEEAQGHEGAAIEAYQSAYTFNRAVGQPAQIIESLVALARLTNEAALRKACVDALLSHFGPLFARSGPGEIGPLLPGAVDPIRFCWHSYLLLDQAQPQAARQLLQHTYRLLQEQATTLDGAAARDYFLHQQPINRAVVAQNNVASTP